MWSDGKPQPLNDNGLRLTLLLLMVAGAFVRLYGLGAWDYYHDEIWHVYVAGQSTLADVIHTNFTMDGHPLLGYVLWHYLLQLWDDPWMARLPSLLAGVLCIPAGYLAGKEIFSSKNGGLFTAFFMAFSCLMIEQSNVVRAYSLMMFFALIMLWSVYRYRDTLRMRYMALYGVAAGMAFLSEFAVAPLAAFTALHLLYSIYRKPSGRLVPFALWGFIHLALLLYLLGFMLLLRQVGGLDFSESHFFLKSENQTALYRLGATVIYFLNFLNEINPLFFPAMTAGSELVGAASAFTLFFALLGGLYQIIQQRRYHLIAHVLLVFCISIAFFYLDAVPMDRSRRSMGMLMAFIILLYYGLAYLFSGVVQRLSWTPLKLTLGAAILLCAAYAVWGQQWRLLRPIEFQQTHEQTQELFGFLDQHTTAQDVIITDWSSYFHFWRRYPSCTLTELSPLVGRADCYKAAIYVVLQDMRVHSSILNLASAQQAWRIIHQQDTLPDTRYVWFVGIQHINVKTMLLNPHFGRQLLHTVDSRLHHYKPQVEQVIREQRAFARFAYGAGRHKKIHYAYACDQEDGQVEIDGEDDCLMSQLLLALPKADVDNWLLHAGTYADPAALLKKIRDEGRKKTAPPYE